MSFHKCVIGTSMTRVPCGTVGMRTGGTENTGTLPFCNSHAYVYRWFSPVSAHPSATVKLVHKGAQSSHDHLSSMYCHRVHSRRGGMELRVALAAVARSF